MRLADRFQHAWNAFRNRDPTVEYREPYIGAVSSFRPDRTRLTKGNERTIVTAVLNRIALDCSAIQIEHVRLDENGRFVEVISSGLNNCLTLDANRDQTGRAFIHDTVLSMLDEGCVALVPVDTDVDLSKTGSFDILTMRTGKILEWYPNYVRVRVYNENSGEREDIFISKDAVAIVENPFHAILNEPNSTAQRLLRKLSLMDSVDEQAGSGKLDLLIQLPYTIKTDTRRDQAERRRKDIEMQLEGSRYGIAYIDSTEKVTQLNRSVENNILKSVEYLTNLLYSQLGITAEIMNGTADEKAMLNYSNRVIEPIMSAITDELKRKFLTKTARSQRQSIMFFRDPFRLVPVNDIAEIADKFTRNEIMTSNEIRQIIGMKPSSDPEADRLRNKNLNPQDSESLSEEEPPESDDENLIDDMTPDEYSEAFQALDDFDSQIDEIEEEFDEEIGDTDTDDEEELAEAEAEEGLLHYASPYYDPVKAHEYYMRTRELKGRRSTAGLNDSGKAAVKYVKEQLTAERKAKVKESKEQTNSAIDTLRTQKKAKVEEYKNEMSGKIESLRAKLKKMSKQEKAQKKEQIYEEIAKLREDNKAERTRLSEELKKASSDLRASHKETAAALKEEYDQKYEEELAKIKADSSMKKTKKSGKKKSSGSSKSKSSKSKKSGGIKYLPGKSRRQIAQEKYGTAGK